MLPGNRSIKQQDEQNKVQLAQLETDNARLQAEVSAAKARAVKLENYTRRENIRLLNVPENEDENCKEIVLEVMAAVKMDGANTVEFHAVHRTGKQRDDGKARAIIARFVNKEMSSGIDERSLPTLRIINITDYLKNEAASMDE